MDAIDLEDWVTPANDAVCINLTGDDGEPFFHEPFHPTFTYAIFGDDEAIPGYKDLQVNLNFRANDLRPQLKIKHGAKMAPFNDQMADLMDIDGKLQDFLPEIAFEEDASSATNGSAANGSSPAWAPPGELLHSYASDGKKYQIWYAGLSDPRAKEIVSNMRVFIPFFIEGGTVDFLDEPDWAIERWKVFLLYQVKDNNYTFAGFSTSYRLWVFPSTEILKATSSTSELPASSLPHANFDTSQSELPEPVSPVKLLSRERISQFIILPPFQHSSHGSTLYTAMTSLFRRDRWVFEITVEEPNEEFDALRDYCDMAYLYTCHPDFRNLTLPSSIPRDELHSDKLIPLDLLAPQDTLNDLRIASKIAPRQFQRVTEIHLLSTIPPRHRNTARISRKSQSADDNDKRYYFWRLLVKERVFIKNKDQLLQIDEAERVGKLEETLIGVQDEYASRIDGLERRMDRGLGKIIVALTDGSASANGATTAGASSGSSNRRKRKVIEDEDEDEEDEEVAEVEEDREEDIATSDGVKQPKSKKMRV